MAGANAKSNYVGDSNYYLDYQIRYFTVYMQYQHFSDYLENLYKH